MTTDLTLGIDSGLSGALALITAELKLVALKPMPVEHKQVDPIELGMWLAAWRHRIGRVGLERSTARPAVDRTTGRTVQGIASTWKTGDSYGVVRGVLGALLLEPIILEPAVWKAAMRVSHDKATSMVAAEAMFPGGPFRGPRGGALDGNAEAALIAAFVARSRS